MEKKKYLAITYEGGNPVYEGWGFWGISLPAVVGLGLLLLGFLTINQKLNRIEKKLEEVKG